MKHKRKRKEISKICKAYSVRYRIKKLGPGFGGQADCPNGIISIESSMLKLSIGYVMSVVVHEISHILAYRGGKYRAYHRQYALSTRQQCAAYLSTALRAELYVDRQGEKMFYRFYPHLKYSRSYRTKKAIAWFNCWLKPTKIFMRSLPTDSI